MSSLGKVMFRKVVPSFLWRRKQTQHKFSELSDDFGLGAMNIMKSKLPGDALSEPLLRECFQVEMRESSGQRRLKTLQKVDKDGIDVAKCWLGFLISWKTHKSTRTSFNLTFWFTEPDVIFLWQQGFDNTYC